MFIIFLSEVLNMTILMERIFPRNYQDFCPRGGVILLIPEDLKQLNLSRRHIFQNLRDLGWKWIRDDPLCIEPKSKYRGIIIFPWKTLEDIKLWVKIVESRLYSNPINEIGIELAREILNR